MPHMKNIKAFVLCGGRGTRLRPYTYTIPKPMLPLGEKPILEYVINNLKLNGIEDITLTVGYLKERIMDYFGDGGDWGVDITYFEEDENNPLNTAGSIACAKDSVNESFVVLMGDHLTTINLRKMVKHHQEEKNTATLGLKKQGTPLEYGIVELDSDGKIVQFKEKPIVTNLINAAIYVFEPEVFAYIKKGLDFGKNILPKLVEEKKKVGGYVFDEYWVDIGRIHDYEHLNQVLSIVDLAFKTKFQTEKHL